MAKIEPGLVKHLGQLAKIKLSPEDIEQYQQEFAEIVNYVEQLQDVDVGDLKPTYQVTGLKTVTRSDQADDSTCSRDELLANAPETKNGYIRVPRIIE